MNININKLWLTFLSLAFVACQSEDMLIETPQPVQQKTPIKVLQGNLPEQMGSRAQIILGNQEEEQELFVWNAHDSFVAYNQSNFDAQHPAVFTISDSYSDETPMSYADFSTDSNDLLIGDRISAVYPSSCVNEEGYAMMEIPNQEFVSGSDEEWRTFFSNYMYMMAQTTFEDETPKLYFEHQSAIIRVTYSNNTYSDKQITSVIVDGHGMSFLRSRGVNMKDGQQNSGGSGNWLQNDFSDLIVPAGEKKDFYFLVFGEKEGEYADGSSLVIHVSTNDGGGVTPELPMTVVAEANGGIGHIEKGKRYWFNVTQTETGLVWSKDAEDFDVNDPGELITNTALIQAIEEAKNIEFIKTEEGYVGTKVNKTLIQSVTWLDISRKGLTSIEGIEYFTELQTLNISQNQFTEKEMDFSNMTKLYHLNVSWNQLTSIKANPEIHELHCGNNNLTELNLFDYVFLTQLGCDSNQLTSLDFVRNPSLRQLSCVNNKLSRLHLVDKPDLEEVNASNNKLLIATVDNCPKLSLLMLTANQLNSLSLDGTTGVKQLYCSENQFTSFELLSSLTDLRELSLNNNQLTHLDITACSDLTMLECRTQKDENGQYVVTKVKVTAEQKERFSQSWGDYLVPYMDGETPGE